MRAFRYRLAAVLAKAAHAERLVQIELARVLETLAQVEREFESLGEVRGELESHARELVGNAPDGVEVARLQAVQDELDGLDALMSRVRKARCELESQVESARETLVRAARWRQVLENHRRGLAEEHRRAELAAETKHLDELGSRGRRGIMAEREGDGEDVRGDEHRHAGHAGGD
jgi:flagellar export protein FliJ